MPKGKVPYNELVEVIKSGGSVLVNGAVISYVDNLPSRLDYAEGDEEEVAAIKKELAEEIQQKQATLDAAEKPKQKASEDKK